MIGRGLIGFGMTIALLVCGSGCGSTAPSTIDGTYVGSIVDGLAGPGSATMTLTSNGSNVTGTWATSGFATAGNNSGTVSGTFSASVLTVIWTPGVLTTTACPFSIVATDNANRVAGTYTGLNCADRIRAASRHEAVARTIARRRPW